MKGACLCGAVEFEVAGQLPNLYHCYCSLCQKQTGGSHNTATLVDEANFNWLKGQDAITSYQKGTGFSAHYCQNCGCPAPNTLDATGKYWIPAGLLEGPVTSQVVLHMHLDSRPPWQTIPTHGHQFATMPSLATIIKLLQA
ncbi:MAG: GFA family protein [Gammaproteobacteria bacterium]|nr:GFA family protein [Gammaproteobacteria bacterium]